MNRDIVKWLESPLGEKWSREFHRHVYELVSIKIDIPDPFGHFFVYDVDDGLVWYA